ncbi:glutamate-5-semialdehyde dehydrogenase [Aliikangiella sp. IMCC44653]
MFSMLECAQQAKNASLQTAMLTEQQKKQALLDMALSIRENQAQIIEENQKDIEAAKNNQLDAAMLDRLMLNAQRVESIAKAIEQIAAFADPVGQLSKQRKLENGLEVAKMSIPLGVIAMVYEARPNVTADAAALCLKAGNAVILRGGKEAINSNLAIARALHIALDKNKIDRGAISVVSDPDRKHMNEMLTLTQQIDLVIPRGGEGLIHFVTKHSQIPVIQHYKGVCHLYVDDSADLEKALSLLLNGKVQRPGVCNALETLVVHKNIADAFLPLVARAFDESQVKVHACKRSIQYFESAEAATAEDFDKEYLALEIAIKVVDDFEAGVSHIQQYSSGHTEVIVSDNKKHCEDFVKMINSAVVMVNASSRFSDGGELGLGAEIGISTSKLHAYGPMGVESLTTEKFVVIGQGQIRS